MDKSTKMIKKATKDFSIQIEKYLLLFMKGMMDENNTRQQCNVRAKLFIDDIIINIEAAKPVKPEK